MARSILSLGMFSCRAATTAARSRGFMAGSGVPNLAATVISRASLPNSFDFWASCRPLRCMMFLNWEWPAMRGLFASREAPSVYRIRSSHDCAARYVCELRIRRTPAIYLVWLGFRSPHDEQADPMMGTYEPPHQDVGGAAL